MLCEGSIIKFENKCYTIRSVCFIPDVLPNEQQKNKPEVQVKIHCESLATGVEEFVIWQLNLQPIYISLDMMNKILFI